MQGPIGIIIFILILIIIEYYGWVAVHKFTSKFKKPWHWAFRILHIILSAALWLCVMNMFIVLAAVEGTSLAKYLSALLIGGTVGKLLIAVMLLLGDVSRLVRYALRPRYKISAAPPQVNEATPMKQGIPRSTFLSQMAILTGAISTGTFLVGTSNKYNYQVKHVPLQFPNLPKAFHGMKIVHISDIHCGSFDDPKGVSKGVRMIMDLKADMIVFTGDLVNNISTEVIPYKEIFKQFSAPLGVFAVLGNHDYGDYYTWKTPTEKTQNLQQLKQHIADMGWELLINKHIVFDKYGDRLALIGVENWSAKSNFPKYGKLAEAYAGIEDKDAAFKILLSHDPSHWDAEVRAKYTDIDLTLSGHTHGMQFGVRLPFMQWSPVKYMYPQWAGLYQEGKQMIYVNAGFGFIGYKGRVGIMPEITLLELQSTMA